MPRLRGREGSKRTLFANETVIAVIGVVRVPCDGAASVAYDSEVELCREDAVSYPRSEGWSGQTKTVGLGEGTQLHTQELMTEAA